MRLPSCLCSQLNSKTSMRKILTFIILSATIGFSSCKKDGTGQEETVVQNMNDLKVPATFTWENSKDINFEITITDTRFKEALHVVSIYDADPEQNGKLLAKGSASIIEPFLTKIYIPNVVKEVFVVKTAPDNSSTTQKVTITGEKLSIQLSAVTKSLSASTSGESKISGLEDSPNCTTGCTRTITTSQNITVNSGEVVCITGNNINVTITAYGGTIRVCGQNVNLGNSTFNGDGKLIVTTGGIVTMSSISFWQASTSMTNYGTLTINNSMQFNAIVLNEGTLNIANNLTIYNGSTFNNNGVVNVGDSFEIQTGNTVTNNGTIVAANDFKVNSVATYINNCFTWAKRNFVLDKNVRNYGYVKINGSSTINSSAELGMYNGAMFSTANLTASGHIRAYGSGTSLAKIASNTTLYNQVQISGPLQLADPNGIETNQATFSNGATSVTSSTLYFAKTNCNPDGNGTAPVTDSDGDGVNDTLDEYPNDPTKAYNNYYPSSSPTSGATLAFEDKWPVKGDYDMNDVVVSYRYQIVTNAANKVVQVIGNYNLHATGGEFQNGFGVEFPIGRSSVSGVSGATLEAGQANAVLVLFTNMRSEMANWNTRTADPVTPVKTYAVSFNVANGPTLATFGLGSYNPFIWNGLGRGYEIHLPGKTPTTLANASLFGTGDDNSSVSGARYYVTGNNLPWAINVPIKPFVYPLEQTVITSGYLRFQSWAESGGSQFADWYSNTGTGYRNTGSLFPN